MKASRITLVLGLVVLSAVGSAVVVACSAEEKAKSAGKKRDAAPTAADDTDPGESQDQEEESDIKTERQALKVLLVTHQGQIDEGEAARSRAEDSRVKAFAGSVIAGHLRAKTRLEELARKKGLTPQATKSSDFLEFQSEGAISHMDSFLDTMRDAGYVTRVIEVEKALLATIDKDISVVVVDEDLKAELATIQAEAVAFMDEAEPLRDELNQQQRVDASFLPASDSGEEGLDATPPPPVEAGSPPPPVEAGPPQDEEPPPKPADAGPPKGGEAPKGEAPKGEAPKGEAPDGGPAPK